MQDFTTFLSKTVSPKEKLFFFIDFEMFTILPDIFEHALNQSSKLTEAAILA